MTEICRYKLRERILFALLWVVFIFCVAGYVNKIFSDKVSIAEASKFQALSGALERANVAYWEWSPATNEMRWSPFLWRILGVTPDRVESYDLWNKLIVEEDRKRIDETVRHAVDEKSSYVTHYRVTSSSGEKFDILETAAWDPARNVLIALCVRTSLEEGEDMTSFLHKLPTDKL